jgi:hypothetical protein
MPDTTYNNGDTPARNDQTDPLKVLHQTIDALVAVKIDLQCHVEVDDHALVIHARKARSACSEIDRAIDELRAAMASLGKWQGW